uniref:subclass B3 metallo-beta-lactamase B3SU1-1 n=1 Tax=uncultured bacterium TaxID=77133 RepID=UPI001C341F54|nr:subclass B3 metallo-beta-lactamase B3SU1-1 [uncultured bacterium]QWJ89341.1 subclass B3 metallo-beta-lactamase B3SU1-1 [uncultured bacterium]
MSARLLFAPLLIALLAGCATPLSGPAVTDAEPGQRAWAQSCEAMDEWDKPGPPFRIYGSTYYVGTCGITALLIAGPEGHTLIDTGTDKGAEVVLANIHALGFEPRDVKTILMSHEHFDHVGGMARLQDATGAAVVTTPAAAAVLRSGKPGGGDPQAASGHPDFPPVTGIIEELHDDRARKFGGTEFRPMFTPGHTPGAMSWSWRACEGEGCKSIVYVDSLNPISADGYRFSDHPELVAAFRKGIAAIAAADCDIVIAPHPVAVQWRDRLLGERALIDRDGCRAFAATASERLDKRLAREAAGG